MKLCVFAGTFNPIHNAHLAMGSYVLEHFNFDKILFIPAFKPPHKDYDENLSEHRLNMVRIAVEDNPKFEISEIEFERDEKSYTYDTIRELYKKYDTAEKISFIIGTDAFGQIETWYKTEELKNLIDFVVFIRENDIVDFSKLKEKGYNYTFANMKHIEISSTDIRERIKQGLSINNFVPRKVEEYIIENGLYKN